MTPEFLNYPCPFRKRFILTGRGAQKEAVFNKADPSDWAACRLRSPFHPSKCQAKLEERHFLQPLLRSFEYFTRSDPVCWFAVCLFVVTTGIKSAVIFLRCMKFVHGCTVTIMNLMLVHSMANRSTHHPFGWCRHLLLESVILRGDSVFWNSRGMRGKSLMPTLIIMS